MTHLKAVISERMSWNMWQCAELAEFTLIYVGEYLSSLIPYTNPIKRLLFDI